MRARRRDGASSVVHLCDGIGRRPGDDARLRPRRSSGRRRERLPVTSPNGNIYAPVMMVAEKAADLIRGPHPAAPISSERSTAMTLSELRVGELLAALGERTPAPASGAATALTAAIAAALVELAGAVRRRRGIGRPREGALVAPRGARRRGRSRLRRVHGRSNRRDARSDDRGAGGDRLVRRPDRQPCRARSGSVAFLGRRRCRGRGGARSAAAVVARRLAELNRS